MGIKNILIQWLQNLLVHGYQNLWITFSPDLQKKEDIKMDEQKKIKILKSFDDGLQKPFSKKQRREIYQNLWLNEGRRPLTDNTMPYSFLDIDDSIHLCMGAFGPLPYQNLLVHGYQKPFGSWVSKPLVHGYQNLLVHGYQKPFGSWVSKPFSQKEDIKMDDQIKIQKPLVHGL